MQWVALRQRAGNADDQEDGMEDDGAVAKEANSPADGCAVVSIAVETEMERWLE